MKKKIQKPLKLNRETLTALCHSDLREAAGMATGLPKACNTVVCTVATAATCGVVNTQCVGW